MLTAYGITDRALGGYVILAILLVAAIGAVGYRYYSSHHRTYQRRMAKEQKDRGEG